MNPVRLLHCFKLEHLGPSIFLCVAFVGCSGREGDFNPTEASSDNPQLGRLAFSESHENPSLERDFVGPSPTVPTDSEPNPFRIDPNDQRPPVLSIQLRDTHALGVPIGLFSDQTLLMRNDGAIVSFRNDIIQSKSILSERFQAIDRAQMAKQLHAEFGRRYQLKQEGPYTIVAQPEQIMQWSQRFRSIYHSYNLYCSTRNLPTRGIEFPLVAVVFGTSQEFQHYAFSEGAALPKNCVGYYSQNSNRIVLYEQPSGVAKETLETICHEATHQLAFNTGLHQRLAGTPLWFAEGFATMFESPTLSGLQARDGRSLWPASRRQEWNALLKNQESLPRSIESLLRSDKLFESDASKAYCISWAMASYLSQRRPEEFSQYVSKMGQLPPFEEYDHSLRIRDFQKIFSLDTRMLSKQVIAYLSSLD